MPLVLLVDAHPASRYLSRYLLGHAGLDVLCARAVDDVLALARSRRHDAIVVDIDLLGCGRICDGIAADPRLATIPIVCVGWDDTRLGISRSRVDVAAGYVPKPIDPATFAGVVVASIERSGAAARARESKGAPAEA
jgi:CheY-like chemotaxis protein